MIENTSEAASNIPPSEIGGKNNGDNNLLLTRPYNALLAAVSDETDSFYKFLHSGNLKERNERVWITVEQFFVKYQNPKKFVDHFTTREGNDVLAFRSLISFMYRNVLLEDYVVKYYDDNDENHFISASGRENSYELDFNFPGLSIFISDYCNCKIDIDFTAQELIEEAINQVTKFDTANL
ncbi:hypothetical protein MUY27_13910 [Mucilaginibacter sp. RS28]|uniref:Uncharacterized protein n=1 Tax=Mucilaginibacter straminoryzae TaxID=2932774 RepID=A0A9X1X6X3_9SPHI|nr:hypothetical protein [Mucilaginibacter straminoryzae]MCJ8210808.1 hypothetical protein [Mucilaginibacter straminoryzae]